MTGPLLVVDGDSLGHRAYHSMPPVTGAGGQPVGLLLGFANMLLAAHRATRPRAIIVCLDARTPSYRHELWPAYQGERRIYPDDLQGQLDTIGEMVEAFGFASAKVVPYEADDLLATAITLEEAAGGSALVLTSDRDAYQLVSERTSVLVPRAGRDLERVDREGVEERYGVRPDQVIDLIALRGDPSDNIPGARGVGPKTAADLLRRHGSLAGVVAAAGELTPRQRESIVGDLPLIERFREVATMRRDVPIARPPDGGLDDASAVAWCMARGITALAERLSAPSRLFP
jgi:DNA polymerase-1